MDAYDSRTHQALRTMRGFNCEISQGLNQIDWVDDSDILIINGKAFGAIRWTMSEDTTKPEQFIRYWDNRIQGRQPCAQGYIMERNPMVLYLIVSLLQPSA